MTLGCHGALRWGWEGAVPRAASSLDSISDAPRLSLSCNVKSATFRWNANVRRL